MSKDKVEDLNKTYSLNFTKQELIIMFNVLVKQDYRIGDAALLYPAVRRIEALVAVDTNIQAPPEAPKEGPILQ